MFPQKWMLGNKNVAVESTGVSVDIGTQQTFPSIRIGYVRGK
jgi:hypothetical protein